MFLYTVDWILEDETNRSGKLLELLKDVPLKSLSYDFLKQAAYHYELFRKDNECLKLLFDALITVSKLDIREKRRTKIDCLNATNLLFALGGRDGSHLSSVSEYDSRTNKWIATANMPGLRSHFGCVVIGSKIYICGGYGYNGLGLKLKDLAVFDIHTQAWKQLRPMKRRRAMCAAAVLQGQIYVAGGWDDSNELDIVERYDVQTDQWEDVAPMLTKRSTPELIAFNEHLYAIGGYDGKYALISVERYDPFTNKWTRMNNTNNTYMTFGSTLLNGKFYIVGADNCEVYTPEDDKWAVMPAPSLKCDFGRRLAAYNGKLYAIGGLTGALSEWKGIDTVEVYDMQTCVWQTERMDIPRCFHCVAVVEKQFFVPKTYIDENEKLNKLRLQNIGCDVILLIGDHQFPAHRSMLISRLEHFRNELSVDSNNKSVIPLDDKIINSKFFDEFLNYVYTSKITFTAENIRPIYRAAKYLCFNQLIYELEEHLEYTVNNENINLYMSIAIELDMKTLQGVFAQLCVQQLFSDINRCSRKNVSTALFEDLKRILQELKKDGNFEDMFHYSIDWIVHDEANRLEKLLELMKDIPPQNLNQDFLMEIISQNGLVRNQIECLSLLLDAVIAPSHNESCKDVLYVIGGIDVDELSSVSEYDSATGEWNATTPMPNKRSLFGCVAIEQKIYVCGGFDKQRNLNELTVFDTLTRIWSQLTPMAHPRQGCAVAALNEHIYVAGGTNGKALAVVERYNLHTGQWQEVAPMNTKRATLELVVLNDLLYAIGGYDNNVEPTNRLTSVERYDPKTNQWTPMSETNNDFFLFGSAVFNDNIYIATENKFEVYNTAFNRWIDLVPKPIECRGSRRLAVINGRLYSIGGKVGKLDEWFGSKTVEVYDFQTRVWQPEADMDVARGYHGVAVIKKPL